jgi:hypothetical protein
MRVAAKVITHPEFMYSSLGNQCTAANADDKYIKLTSLLIGVVDFHFAFEILQGTKKWLHTFLARVFSPSHWYQDRRGSSPEHCHVTYAYFLASCVDALIQHPNNVDLYTDVAEMWNEDVLKHTRNFTSPMVHVGGFSAFAWEWQSSFLVSEASNLPHFLFPRQLYNTFP